MPSVCHLTSVHDARDTRILLHECRSLAHAGYRVFLVAPAESDIVDDDIIVKRVPKPSRRLERMTKTAWAVYRAARETKADIYHFHDAELMVVGILLKLQGKIVVFDAHEDLPDDFSIKLWVPKPLRWLAALFGLLLTKIAGLAFPAIVSATPVIASRFPKHKTTVIHNYPLPEELIEARPTPFQERPPRVVYVGKISWVRGINEMIGAIDALTDAPEVRLTIAGTFDSPELETHVRALAGWERVDFLGWQPRAQVRELLGSARVGLVLFHPEAAHLNALPNKLFEYMASQIPVVASDFPLWRTIVGEAGCGVLVDPLDRDAIAEAIQRLIREPGVAEQMGRRGREAVISRYNWTTQASQLLVAYSELSHAR